MRQIIQINILLTILLFCFVKTNGQTLDSLLKTLKLPDKWTVSINKDSGYFNEFDRKIIATIFFSNGKNATSYFVFNYKSSDSLIFMKGWMNFLKESNCEAVINNDQNKILSSFVKDDFYFLLELCPCNAMHAPDCGILAMTLNDWIRKK